LTLPLLLVQIFKLQDWNSTFDINLGALKRYFITIERGYVKTNPYHSSAHVADVAQATHLLLSWASNRHPQALTAQEVMSGVFAAAIHDYQHPGFNNQFLIAVEHPVALRYNDRNVLENHHVAAAFNAMLDGTQEDPFKHLSEDQFTSLRRMVIKMVLATDNQNHSAQLSLLKTKMTRKDFPSTKGDDKQLLLNIILHAADISNPTRPLECYLKWVPRVMEEFFRQGDLEKQKHLPVSPFFDRDTTAVSKCQLGFIDVLVHPLYLALGQCVPEVNTECLPQITRNRAHYEGRRTVTRRMSNDKGATEGRRNSPFSPFTSPFTEAAKLFTPTTAGLRKRMTSIFGFRRTSATTEGTEDKSPKDTSPKEAAP